MAQFEGAGISDSQQHGVRSVLTQPSLSLENCDPRQTAASQGKQSMVHDFLSICGSGRSSSSAVNLTNNGSVTQDLLQPLQKDLIPGATNFLPHAFVLDGVTSHVNTSHMSGGAGQQNSFVFVGNGSFQPPASFPSKQRSSTMSFSTKAQIPRAISLNKLWQQQQQQQQQEVLDGNKRLAMARVPSEDDDDEEESYDHSCGTRKESRYQKNESVMQQGEGRNMDSKGGTSRSKHSATEQRRRSKINDRFQMLRQLLPNADQKRDKASFLLEVIEYIKMLHGKVKKYEAAEIKSPLQEGSKVLCWDKGSVHQDLPSHNAQETVDQNGYIKTRLSPLRVVSDDAVTSSELRGNVVQLPAYQGCVSSYENKAPLSKPIPLSFSCYAPTPTLDQAPDHMHQCTVPQQLMPDARATFGQLFCTGEPLALLRSTPSNQDVQVSRNSDKMEEAEDQMRVNQAADIGSTSKDGGNHDRRATSGKDGSGLEQRSDARPADEQPAPPFLGGVINISSVYSQGLLDKLTRALQSSGVDLAQASISVQIDLGKPGDSVLPTSKQMASLGAGALSKRSTRESQGHAPKRPKVEAE